MQIREWSKMFDKMSIEELREAIADLKKVNRVTLSS
jgi:hypothetical protein